MQVQHEVEGLISVLGSEIVFLRLGFDKHQSSTKTYPGTAERNYEWEGLEIKIQHFVCFSGKLHNKCFKA